MYRTEQAASHVRPWCVGKEFGEASLRVESTSFPLRRSIGSNLRHVKLVDFGFSFGVRVDVHVVVCLLDALSCARKFRAIARALISKSALALACFTGLLPSFRARTS